MVLGNLVTGVALPLLVKTVRLFLTGLPGEFVPRTKHLSVLPLSGTSPLYLLRAPKFGLFYLQSPVSFEMQF